MTEHIEKLLSCAELLLINANKIADLQLRHTMYGTACDILGFIINPVITIEREFKDD